MTRCAKRVDFVRLAVTFEPCRMPESGSKLPALHTLRAVRTPLCAALLITSLRFLSMLPAVSIRLPPLDVSPARKGVPSRRPERMLAILVVPGTALFLLLGVQSGDRVFGLGVVAGEV
jgi:hypothetical protein